MAGREGAGGDSLSDTHLGLSSYFLNRKRTSVQFQCKSRKT